MCCDEVHMYTVVDSYGELLYAAIKGDRIVVQSSMIKHLWESKENFGDFEKYQSVNIDMYFSDDSILENKKLVW